MSRRHSIALALAALLAGACWAQSAEPGGAEAEAGRRSEQAEGNGRARGFDLRVQNYASGFCSLVSIGGSDRPDPLVDSCHGWRVSSCRGIMLVVSDEPRLARASIVRERSSGDERPEIEVTDLNEAILAKLLSTRQRRQDIISLSFDNIRCASGGSKVAYDGSFIEAGVSGPGIAMRGTVVVGTDGVSVRM